MKLMHSDIAVIILIVFAIYAVFFLIFRKSYFKFINNHWLRKNTFLDKAHLFCYMLFWAAMISALADIRGPEQKVDVEIPDQKTIILIDTSLSMLVEDIRPSRFEKSLMIARHFVKNTFSGQISIVLFSDIQKKYIPFTDDTDLLESRLSVLSDGRLVGGGSNIKQAIMESIGYLKEFSNGPPMGNLLVLTDGEDHEEFPLDEAYDNIAVAVVGIGTLVGDPIPLRDEKQRFIEYKESHGEKIISKLNENSIKELGKNFRSFHYWIATSYSLPTDEINAFFNNHLQQHLKDDSIAMRPIYSHYIVILAVCFLFLSVVFFNARTFKAILGITILLISCHSVSDANDQLIDKFKKKNLSREEKVALASDLLEKDDFKNARIIYDEMGIDFEKDSFKNIYNYGISLMGNKETERGLAVLRALEQQERSKGNTELVDKINRNVLFFLAEELKQKDKEKQDERGKENSNNEQSSDGENQKQCKDGNQSEQAKNEKQGTSLNDDRKDDDRQRQVDDGNEKKQPSSSPETLQDKHTKERQRRTQIKIPGLLKQLLSDDKNLQKKMFSTISSQKGSTQGSKDW
ncbi:MAG: VWA domain-containing protein [Bdellovibrio sp.]|nr:VWA domain-containing protein [Bdellovibrio sp.]